MSEVAENVNPWTVFLELHNPDTDPSRPLPTFDKDQDVMLFFKYYCPRTGKIHYMSHLYLAITTKLSSVLPKLCNMANIPADSKLILWEEIKPNMLEKIEDTNQPLEHILEELMDGDIIVFQQDPGTDHSFELPTARDYFRDLFYKVGRLVHYFLLYLLFLFLVSDHNNSIIILDIVRFPDYLSVSQVEVNFCDKNIPGDPGFLLELSQRMNYEAFTRRVAAHLDTNPLLLQFFKSQVR